MLPLVRLRQSTVARSAVSAATRFGRQATPIARRFGAWFGYLVAATSTVLPGAVHAVTLSITPTAISSEYQGTVTLDIGGLTSGQTVRVDTYLDADHDGAIRVGAASEPLVQSFEVSDGQLPIIGGVRLPAVPGDEDEAADGRVRAVLDFRSAPLITRTSAQYVYQVSMVGGGGGAATALFAVDQPAYAQRVSGRVTSNGAPVPYAFAFLLAMEGDSEAPAAMTLTDTDGRFSLNAAPGDYGVGALRSGVLLTSPPAVTLGVGQTVTQNLTMIPADRTISGRLTETTTGQGIGGVLMFSANNYEGSLEEEGSLATIVFTDIDGNFAVPVVAGEVWGISGEVSNAILGGYLAAKTVHADTRSGSVSGLSIQWPKATAVVYGTLTGGAQQPIPDVTVRAYSDQLSGMVEEPEGLTGAAGDYVLGVLAGRWDVGPDNEQLLRLGYLFSGSESAMVASGEARRVDLVATVPNAHVRGRLIDVNRNPLSGISPTLCSSSCSDREETAADGSFDAAVVGGTWSIFFSEEQLRERNLVGPQVNVTIVDGIDVALGDLVALPVNGGIHGWVRLDNGAPLGGVGVYAFANVEGLAYRTEAEANANGDYSLPAANATWQVYVICNGFDELGYRCPASQVATVSNNNPVLNFVVERIIACGGDCGGDGEVTVDEIIAMVNISLGSASTNVCLAGDGNSDGEITIDEIIVAVNHTLIGCGA